MLAVPALAAAQVQVVDPDASLTPKSDKVTLTFDAPVEIRQVTVEIVNTDGITIGKRPVLRAGDDQVVVADIDPGTTPWLIAWRVLSRDGHVSSGIIGGDPRIATPDRPTARVVAAAGRGVAVAALAVIVGLVVFRWGAVGAGWREGGLTTPGTGEDDAQAFRDRAFPILEWASNRWWDALWVSVSAWGLGLAATVFGTLWALDSTDLGGLLFHARLGQASLGMAVLGVLTVAFGLWITRRKDGDDPLPPTWQAVCLGGPAAIGLALVAWSGHAAVGAEAGLNVVLDAVHGLGSAAWIGGLVGILALLLPAGWRLEEPDRIRLLAAAVVRFSAIGLAAVSLLVITGIYRAIAEVGSFGDLFGSAYGWVLVAKVAVFAVMCAVAGYNRFVLHPRLERAGLGLEDSDQGAAQRLASSVGAELALGVVVLVLVGFLIGLAPPA